MVRSTGFKKVKTTIFISGNGSNMKNLIKFSKIKNSPIEINLVLSSNKKANALNYLKKKRLILKFLTSRKKIKMKRKF